MNQPTELLKELTLVIPSYNRQAYLLRSLKYWDGRGPQVYALDGSGQAISENAIKDFGENIHYLHLPLSYRERLNRARNIIRTRYVALLADDDFYLPSGLVAAIASLESDSSLVACVGRPLGFNYNKKNAVVGINGVYQDMYNDYIIDSEKPAMRIFDHMNRYMPSTMYAILRTEDWRKSLEAHVRHEFPIFSIIELQMELTISYLGKTKVIPFLSWLKSTELEQAAGPDISLLRTNEFHDWWPSPEYKQVFRDKFLEVTAEVFSEFDGRDRCVISKEIEVAMDAYVAWCERYFKKAVSFYRLREALKVCLPKIIVSVITHATRKMRRLQNSPESQRTLIECAKAVEKSGTSVNFHELNEIVALVADFHANSLKKQCQP